MTSLPEFVSVRRHPNTCVLAYLACGQALPLLRRRGRQQLCSPCQFRVALIQKGKRSDVVSDRSRVLSIGTLTTTSKHLPPLAHEGVENRGDEDQ